MLYATALRSAQLRPLGLRMCRVSIAPRCVSPRSPSQIVTRRLASTNTTTKTAATGPKTAPERKYMYPERLCIYHAGTGRVTFLACLKLSTIFVFAFFGFVVTPTYIEKTGWGDTTLRTVAAAVGPLLIVGYLTSPFVSFMHLRLPPFARVSEEALRSFIRRLPAQAQTTELDITTMSVIAKPRVSKVKLSDLRPANQRFGIVNYVRDTTAENATRKWYNFSAVGKFNVQHNKSPRVRGIWEEVATMIAKQTA
ncbi:hypothetical protein PG990_012473 [Apiospora arundinis]|uniref:Paired amphipathic helix protein n=1 Tax=Apiospora arundinis TaxID=335852 RepID=A0ABR2HQZ1_9PEZI